MLKLNHYLDSYFVILAIYDFYLRSLQFLLILTTALHCSWCIIPFPVTFALCCNTRDCK